MLQPTCIPLLTAFVAPHSWSKGMDMDGTLPMRLLTATLASLSSIGLHMPHELTDILGQDPDLSPTGSLTETETGLAHPLRPQRLET